MKQISELTFDALVKYDPTHTWAKTAGDLIVVGITDYAQDQLGEIIYVELPQPGDTFNQGDEFGMVESAKTSSELYMPVGGEIVEINSQLEDSPDIINQDPFQAGWMIKVKPDDPARLDGLLSAEDYKGGLS